MARVTLPERDSLPEALQSRWDRTASRGSVLNIQRLFLVNTEIELNAFRVWRASGLSDRAREIVILRAAFTQESRYEWHQHVRIARGAGLTDAEINAVTAWRDATCFSPAERALLAYVDAMAAGPRPSDDVFAAVATGRSDAEMVGVTFLVGLYFSLAKLMAAFDLETEEPFVGWRV
ncbi:MAG: carboxymuconolactone decarboxylase family protein [Dehalococcoidia bacterium]